MSYIVAIVGRPNVGKSTLFNRLIEERKAIVDNISGVTRDRQYGEVDWNGKQFSIVDTGGYVPNSADVFEQEIFKQVKLAINEANAIVFMVDVKTGITHLDDSTAQLLRKTTKPIYVVVNKIDNHDLALQATEFYAFGFENLFTVSSITGSGTGELLDAICEPIEVKLEEEQTENTIPKIAIVGQPNVGKSSLLNVLIGQERTIVSDIAGTTRDSIFTKYNLFQKELILIDTAGIRKKSSEKEDLEFYSIIRAIKAIEESDICILMIDAEKGITAQDVNIFSVATRKGKGVLIVVNKWDLIEKDTNTAKEFEKRIKEKIAPFNDLPILFVSVKDKLRIMRILETALQVFENRQRKISTSKLNDTMLKLAETFKAPVVRGHLVRIKYVSQIPTVVPSFAFYTNFPNDIKTPYKNFLENKLREHFNFSGVPIRIFFRKK